MAVLDPITPFLSLIDRLISLIRERETRRREYFEKIIDPLYTQFRPLGENYLVLFREAKAAVETAKGSRGKAAAAEGIRRKREEFTAARAQLSALLDVCAKKSTKKKDQELIDFLVAMKRFFWPEVRLGSATGIGSLGAQLVDLFEDWDRSGRTINPQGIVSATARLETSWYEIAGRYMALKLKYVVGEQE